MMWMALKILAAVIVLLIVAGGVFIAATWAPERSVADLKARWAPPPSTFIDLLGMQVHLRDEGPRDDASPIVLMHGTGSSLHAWEGWVAALKEKHRVITFDLPGYGLTGPSPDNVYGGERDVAFVIALLDKLGIARATLGGNSLGAAVALRAALAHPGRVGRLILVDGGYPVRSQSMPIGFHLLFMPGVRWLMQHTLPRFLVVQGMRNVWGDPAKITPEMIDRAVELTQREGNRAAIIARFGQRWSRLPPPPAANVKVPTLILWGGRDRLVPRDAADALHREIAGSTLVVFEKLGHAPEEEDPQATVAVVKAFLNGE
jgi:pimeloyl-ACP methyl ester carboxylesterase